MATLAPARQHSPLGDDHVIPIVLVANEQISRPFTFDVYAVCQQCAADRCARLNQPSCITLQNTGTPVRCFHGIIQAISAEGVVSGQTVVDQFQTYHLVPRTGPEARRHARLHQFLESGRNIATGGLGRLPAETG